MALVSFEEMYRRYATDVLRFATYLTGDRTRAEDLTSEAFVRAWTTPAEVAEPAVKPYLFAIVRNLHRRETSAAEQVPAGMADAAPQPDVIAEQRLALHRVWERLREFPESDRAALLLRAIDDMPYEQIAEVLGMSVASAKVKVHRARMRLARWKSEES